MPTQASSQELTEIEGRRLTKEQSHVLPAFDKSYAVLFPQAPAGLVWHMPLRNTLQCFSQDVQHQGDFGSGFNEPGCEI